MKKSRTILAFLCSVLIAVPVAVAEPQKEKISLLDRSYKTLKNRMKCLRSTSTKCTQEQKKMIRNAAIALAIGFILYVGWREHRWEHEYAETIRAHFEAWEREQQKKRQQESSSTVGK